MQENEGKKENEKEEVVKENGDVLKTIADITKNSPKNNQDKRLLDTQKAFFEEKKKVNALKSYISYLKSEERLDEDIAEELEKKFESFEPSETDILNDESIGFLKKVKRIFKKNIDNIKTFGGISEPERVLTNFEHFYKNVADQSTKEELENSILGDRTPSSIVKKLIELNPELDSFYRRDPQEFKKSNIEKDLEQYGGFDGFLKLVESNLNEKDKENSLLKEELESLKSKLEEFEIHKEKGYSKKVKENTFLRW